MIALVQIPLLKEAGKRQVKAGNKAVFPGNKRTAAVRFHVIRHHQFFLFLEAGILDDGRVQFGELFVLEIFERYTPKAVEATGSIGTVISLEEKKR